MQGFLQEKNSLIWTLNHETVRIEPWGRDSLRVRATVSAGIRDDLLSVLLKRTYRSPLGQRVRPYAMAL
jgi:alpha-D-xyloside xylohydrolase